MPVCVVSLEQTLTVICNILTLLGIMDHFEKQNLHSLSVCGLGSPSGLVLANCMKAGVNRYLGSLQGPTSILKLTETDYWSETVNR